MAVRKMKTSFKTNSLLPQTQGKTRSFLVAFLMAASLASCLVSFFYFTSTVAQELSFLSLSVPAIIQIRQKNVDWKLVKKSFLVVVPFLASLAMSYLLNINESHERTYALVLMGNLTLSFFIFSVVGSRHDRDVWKDVMRILLFFLIPIFLFVLFTQRNAYFMGRWQPYFTGDVNGAHPNWWGNMALGLGWCALAWEKSIFRFAGLAVAAYFMFLLQSRGALVALVVAFICCSGYFFPFKPKRAFVLFFIFLFGIVLVALAGDSLLNFFSHDVLLLDDPDRGAGSGLSGRTEGYAIALNSLFNDPIFGNGIGMFGFVHNGFLLILAEGGIFALFSVIYLFATSIRRYMKSGHGEGAGYILSYIVLLMTYPRLFNTNMTSILIMMVIMRGLCYVKQKKVPPRNWVMQPAGKNDERT